MNALQLAGAGWHEKHVAPPQQRLGPVGIQNGPGVRLGRHLEAEPRGEIGLDNPREHVHRRPLGGQNQVNPRGPRHLGQAGQGDLHVAGSNHHEIGQLIDNNHDIGQVFGSVFLVIRPFAVLGDLLVVLGNVAHPLFGEQLIAPFHFSDGPEQGVGGLLDIGHDRRNQVGDSVVHGQLDAFGIHHDQLGIVGRRFVEKTADHGVEGHALAGPGRPGNQ